MHGHSSLSENKQKWFEGLKKNLVKKARDEPVGSCWKGSRNVGATSEPSFEKKKKKKRNQKNAWK